MYDKYYYEELLELKEKGELKPLSEFKRDELKILMEELVTVNDMVELFEVSKSKVQILKETKMIRDMDLLQEMQIKNIAEAKETSIYSAKKIIEETLKEGKDEETKKTLLAKLDNEILKTNELYYSMIKERFYWSEKEELQEA